MGWKAKIKVQGKDYTIGEFDTAAESDAAVAKVRKQYLKEMFSGGNKLYEQKHIDAWFQM